MNRALPIVTSAGDMAWSDNHSLSSDEGRREAWAPQPQMDHTAWNASNGATTQMQGVGGQISPASTGMETIMENSAAPTANSAPSSTGSWGSGNAELENDEADHDTDVRWEAGSDDVLKVPKLEPLEEEEFNFDDVKAAPLPSPGVPNSESANNPQAKPKRPRGRPRKHPINPVPNASKITKGRSKTGCITCRKRKKKCDEAKPRCMNCEKNAVVCEGYHEKQIWRSGKERAEEDRLRKESLPNITLHPLFHGVETIEDQIFWKHYVNNFSSVLTVEGESRNAFKDIVLHLANRHQGLMHSLLSVSSKHIDFDSPYGQKLMQDHPSTSIQALQDRSDHHHDDAMTRFCEDINNAIDKDDPEYQSEEYQTILAARYGQILCRILQTRAEGNASGEHRLHLKAFKALIEDSPPQDPAFYTFITEFFQYHIYADDLLWHPDTGVERLSSEDWEPATQIQTPRLIGVADNLLQCLAIISTLRNKIRANIAVSVDPPVDYVMLFRAAEINNAIQEWTPYWPTGDCRNRVGLLYKQMMFIYLFRTIYPPSQPSRSGYGSVSSSASSTPQRRASMAASVVSTASAPSLSSFHAAHGFHSLPASRDPSHDPSRHSSMHETDSRGPQHSFPSSRASSPPPKRRPAIDDPRLLGAVDESLAILESFSPSDPAQTLLLIPCMIVGIACFDLDRRERARKAIRTVKGYTGMRNCDRVLEVLEEVWGLMDAGDWVSVWDWQGVARRMGIDALVT